MFENKKQNVTRDYKERFEFKLTVGDNIICQRYFKINNYNEQCIYSTDLKETIDYVVKIIDDELKSKTADYLEVFAPMYFNSMEQMEKYFESAANRNRIRPGLGIVVKGEKTDFCWGKNLTPVRLGFKFDDGELTKPLTENDEVTYKFAFLVDSREVCVKSWNGLYPKFIRNAIDLSNKKGKISEEALMGISFEEYLNYKISVNRSDLVYTIIKEICTVCCLQGDNCYNLVSEVGDLSYKNKQSHKDICKLYNLSSDGLVRFKSRKEVEFWSKK